MPKISIINKSFGEKTVIRDFVYAFADTGFYAIMGSSGIGKTTLLRILAGLDTDFEGSLMGFDGKKSFVFQENRLLPNLTALENITFVGADAKKAKALLDKMGLEAEYDTKPPALSGGMQRRVAIARALAADHKILLMDEPFSSLDENRAESVMSMIRENSGDKLVIFVTHDMDEVKFFNATPILL